MVIDACPISPSQLRSLNHAVVSCGMKIFNVNTSVIAAKCLMMFGSATSLRLWPRVKRDLLRDSCQTAVWSARYVLFVVTFPIYLISSSAPISVNKRCVLHI